MLEINLSQTFYELTKDDPALRACLVAFGFKQMAEDKLYHSVGRLITLDKALKFINKLPEDLIEHLASCGFKAQIIA